MKTRFCIVGATRGTGFLIAQKLLSGGFSVRIVARDSDKARRVLGNRAEVIYGDVINASTVRHALSEDCKAIFFTVAATGGIDGRGLFASRAGIREVTYQGLVNVVEAMRSTGFNGRIVLPSVVALDRPSAMLRILDMVKPGLRRNLIEREIYLRRSGLDYIIVRAPILTNASAGAEIRITRGIDTLTAGSKISRADFARIMILAAQQNVISRVILELTATKGAAPSDAELLKQLTLLPD
jgi:nucleoside-diphosphate-sugar epimerase